MDIDQRLISIASNSLVAATDFVALVILIYFVIKNWVNIKEARLLAIGLLTWITGGIIRIGYWVPAIWLARNGEPYHPWFIEHRAWSYTLSAPLLVIGVWSVMGQLMPTKRTVLAVGFTLAVAFSAMTAWAFYITENNRCSRGGVIEFFDAFIYGAPGVRIK